MQDASPLKGSKEGGALLRTALDGVRFALMDAIPERPPDSLSPEAVQLLELVSKQPAMQLKSAAAGALLRDGCLKRARGPESAAEAQ